MKRLIRNTMLLLPLLAVALLAGCNSSETSSNAPFSIAAASPSVAIQEGDATGVSIPISISRASGHTAALSLTAVTTDQHLSTSFNSNELTPENDSTTLIVNLAIADLPILAHSKTLDVTASDGTNTVTTRITLQAVPTTAPDIYLLVGQSNMVGFSGDGTKQAFAGGLDEPHPRIKQLNVSKNDQFTVFVSESDFTSETNNAVPPFIVQAEDPLHIPLDESNTSGKDLNYIGLGLSFAKAALANTTTEIVLVPAAWSGSAFCYNNGGPIGQWNALPTSNPELGNNWMFERAVTRANMAIDLTGGVLRGILWHQGESDANDRCAASYEANLTRLAEQLRLRIKADARGSDLRLADANIPFIVGTMSKGGDDRDPDVPNFSADKLLIDSAHRNIERQREHSAFSNHDDLIPAGGFPCGNTTCIHFGPQALREMGSRYYLALLNAVNN